MKKAFTENILSWYNFGSLLLFIGLLWMFLPHAVHDLLLSAVGEQEEHYTHLIQGLAVALVGLGIMYVTNSKKTS